MDFDDYDIPAASEEEQQQYQQQLPPPVPENTSFEDQGTFSTEEALVVPPSHEISEVYNMPEPEPVGEDALS